jgi:hypothetical protein
MKEEDERREETRMEDNRRMKDLNAPLEQITQLEKLNDRALSVEIYFYRFRSQGILIQVILSQNWRL